MSAAASSSPSSSTAALRSMDAAFRSAVMESARAHGLEGEMDEILWLQWPPGGGEMDSNMINGDKPLLWKKAPLQAGSKKCSVCKTSKAESDYSGAQLKRQGKRMCADCVVARQANTPLPEPSGPVVPHTIVLMNASGKTDRTPFLPGWNSGELPAELTWLAADAPASHTPPDAATLAARRAIVEPFFVSEPFERGALALIGSNCPYFTAANSMGCERVWIKTAIVHK